MYKGLPAEISETVFSVNERRKRDFAPGFAEERKGDNFESLAELMNHIFSSKKLEIRDLVSSWGIAEENIDEAVKKLKKIIDRKAALDISSAMALAHKIPAEICAQYVFLNLAAKARDHIIEHVTLPISFTGKDQHVMTIGQHYGSNIARKYLRRGYVIAQPYVLTSPESTDQSEFYLTITKMISARIKTLKPGISESDLLHSTHAFIFRMARECEVLPWTFQGFVPLPETYTPASFAETIAGYFIHETERRKLKFIEDASNFFTSVRGVDIKGGLERGLYMKHGYIFRLARVNSGLYARYMAKDAGDDLDKLKLARKVFRSPKKFKGMTTTQISKLEELNSKNSPDTMMALYGRLQLPEEHREVLEQYYMAYFYPPNRVALRKLSDIADGKTATHTTALRSAMVLARITASHLLRSLEAEIGSKKFRRFENIFSGRVVSSESEHEAFKRILLREVAKYPFRQEHHVIITDALEKSYKYSCAQDRQANAQNERAKNREFCELRQQAYSADDFGSFLRLLRLSRGLTLEGAGKEVGVGRESIRQWEENAYLPEHSKLAKISRQYNLPEDQDQRLYCLVYKKQLEGAIKWGSPTSARLDLKGVSRPTAKALRIIREEFKNDMRLKISQAFTLDEIFLSARMITGETIPEVIKACGIGEKHIMALEGSAKTLCPTRSDHITRLSAHYRLGAKTCQKAILMTEEKRVASEEKKASSEALISDRWVNFVAAGKSGKNQPDSLKRVAPYGCGIALIWGQRTR